MFKPIKSPTIGLLAFALMSLTAFAQIGGTGWTPKTLNFKIQSPTNASQSLRYWFTNNIYHCLTFSNDGAFSVGNTTLPRTEQRFNPDYTNGEIHYQAMFNVPGNENSYSIFQIHTGDAQSDAFGSTTFMAFWFTNNNGSVHDYSGTTLATNLAGKWFQLNFDHNVITRTIRVWINQQLVWTQQDNGAGDFYIKDGVYEQSHGPTLRMDTSISNILEWTSSGTNPPAGPTGLTATQTNKQFKLAWIASVGATNYNVKRATNSAGPFTNVLVKTTATNYTDSTAVLGPTYYYVVSAIDAFGESTNSSKASVTLDPGYSISALPLAQTVNYGDGTNFTITITTNKFFSGTIDLAVTVLPLIAPNFTQTSFTHSGSTTLSLQPSPGASPGTYPFTIFGMNGSFVVTTNATFTLLQPHPLMSVPTLQSGGFLFSGGGGVPGGPYYVLTSTNLSLPATQWTAIATGSFDSNGSFTYTNTPDPNSPQLYYRLQTP